MRNLDWEKMVTKVFEHGKVLPIRQCVHHSLADMLSVDALLTC